MSQRVSELNSIHPLDCPVVAQVRSDHANCTWFYDHGYIRYNDGTKLMLREHQRVAMAAYGSIEGCHVHHIDRNRLNNRADNLAVVSSTEHHLLHGQQYRQRVSLTCPVCNATFEVRPSLVKHRNPTYCSNACRSIGRQVVARPTAEQLSELITLISNWCELGRMFGVSDNAVRKWARAYGLL